MLARLRTADGFTLVELLVVILIIAALAAIAIPTFLGQSDKAKDASAKADVRNAVSAMEACAADRESGYTDCTLDELRRRAPSLPWDASFAAGRVSLAGDLTRSAYMLVAWSRTNMVFAIGRNQPDPAYGMTGPAASRRCAGANRFGGAAPAKDGGCPGGRTGIASW